MENDSRAGSAEKPTAELEMPIVTLLRLGEVEGDSSGRISGSSGCSPGAAVGEEEPAEAGEEVSPTCGRF